MRYFLVSYLRKPNGQMDEQVAVAKNLKRSDYQTTSVILDFKLKSVVQANMQATAIPKEWEHIRDFYYKYYKNYIDGLEKRWSPPSTVIETSPDTVQELS
jgi:hypothetical protein